MKPLLIVIALTALFIAVTAFSTYRRRVRLARARIKAHRAQHSLHCYHNIPAVDCDSCKPGVSKKNFTRAERRRTERHNRKVLKRLVKNAR